MHPYACISQYRLPSFRAWLAIAALLALALSTLTAPVRTEAATLKSDVEALLSIVQANPKFDRTGNWTGDPCIHNWVGIVCKATRVTQLDLSKSTLTGPIPAAITNLLSLTKLDLSRNALSGFIPTTLSQLASLRDLDLSHNALTGPIPDISSFRLLLAFDLSHNFLSGPFPPKIGQLSSLVDLDIAHNDLSGALPSALGGLSRLTKIDLSHNALTGDIPPEIGKLSLLTELDLAHNSFTGSIPPSIGNLSSLLELDLTNSAVSGPIPPEIGKLSHLLLLDLDRNSLSGAIPPQLGQLTSLSSLDLAGNNLTGPIPPEIGNLRSLHNLDLSDCALTGPIPPELSNLSLSLSSLSLANNGLTGAIPGTIGRFGSLSYLSLSENFFTGKIPKELGNLSSLSHLSLAYNNLSDEIPPEIGGLASISFLSLSGNLLTGSIPSSLSSLSFPAEGVLRLSGNRLTGSVPVSAAGWPNGTDLTANYFNGSASTGAGKFHVGLNCLGVSSERPYVVGQRDAQACGEVYPQLTCECKAPLAIGANGGCYCVKPLNFLAVFTANESDSLGNFSANLGDTMRQIAQELGVSYEQVAVLGFSNLGVKGVLVEVNLLPGGDSKEFSERERKAIRENALAMRDGGTVSVPFFSPGPSILQSEDLLGPLDAGNTKTGNKTEKVALVVSLTILFLLILVAALGLTLWLRRRYTNRPRSVTIQDTPAKQWKLAELKAATNNFDISCELGQGGFATVYKATMDDGVTMAVKRLSDQALQKGGHSDFIKEVQTIGSIHNRNLLALRGYCIDGDEYLLVYDFMPNGSLEDLLFGSETVHTLEWSVCVNIIVGTAHAIAYLHEGCKEKIIHRDIKPANILLDADFAPYVSDFGLVRSTMTTETHVTTKVAGTLGYVAPEYANTGHVTEKSDVFSYGVLILVVLGHRNAIDTSGNEMYINIVDKAHKAAQKKNILQLIAPHFFESYDQYQAERLISIALLCTQPDHQERPTMGTVVQMLNGNMDIPSVNFMASVPFQVSLPPLKTSWKTTFNTSEGASGTTYASNSTDGNDHTF